jgi:tetratricopeptide (TPR) repeat protein
MTVDPNRVRELFFGNQPEQAADLARLRDTKTVHDSALHLAWADLLEEMGLVDEVLLELNLAVRDNPGHRKTCARLAEIYLDQGQWRRATQVWAELAKTESAAPEVYREWGRVLEEAQEYEKADEVYRTGLERTGDPEFGKLIRNLDFLKGEPSAPAEVTDMVPLMLQPHHLAVFTSLFAGREGVYARQWISPTGEYGYTPVQEPLTPKVAENHILGNLTAGVYPVRMDNTVNFIAFDFDLAKFALRKSITNQKVWQTVMNKVHQAACRLLDLGAAQELSMYLEDSGFKGRHVWIFLETPVPAGVAKKCGELLAARLQPLPPEVIIEVFPKQGSVPRGGLGNLIKLPLGLHKRTGLRAQFITPDGQPIEDQLNFLLGLRQTPRRLIYGLIQRFQSQGDPQAPTGRVSPAELPDEISETSAGGLAEHRASPLPSLQEVYDLERDGPFQTLLMKCPVLKAVMDKVNQTSLLDKDETMVLIHTVGHLPHGPQAVNEIFQRCLNADPALFLKSRLRGNPMSCPKIRSRLPRITSAAACNCAFDMAVNLYPTPLIHSHGTSGEVAGYPLGLTVDSLQFQNLVQDYLKHRKQIREAQILLERYEARLIEFFEAAGVDTVQTPLGRLIYDKKEEGKVRFMLEI